MSRLRILLVDDHALLRGALRAVLQEQPGMEVVGEAGDGHEAVRVMTRLMPDVILLDITMPGLSGPETALLLKKLRPAPRILALSAHEDEASVRRMLLSGADGFVPKSSSPEELLLAIQRVASGADGAQAASDAASRALTTEEEVLKRFAQGHSLKRIATELRLDVAMAEQHREQGMRRLGLKTRADVARLAARRGWG